MGYIIVISYCLSDTKDYSKPSQIITFMEVVSNSASAKNCLITRLSRASEPSKQFLISVWRHWDFWFQLRQRQIRGEWEGTLYTTCHSWKNDIFALEGAKYTAVKEEKQLSDMKSVSEGRKHGPLLCNRLLCKYFKNVKEIECVTATQKDNAQQKNHVWRSVPHSLHETWTHLFAGRTLSPGLKSLHIKASRWIQVWKF